MDKVDETTEAIQESTTVEQTEVDVDAMFGMPGAENVMLPEDEGQKKPSIFSKENVSTEFLENKTIKEDTSASTEDTTEEPSMTNEEVEADIEELNKIIEEEESDGNVGRPRLDKNGLHDLTSKMIEEGTLIPFDDDKKLEDYSVKDYRELLEANFEEREAKVMESMPSKFFQSLPEELQIAAKYVADGGQDLKGLFRTLSEVTEIVDLDLNNNDHHSEIVRQYLHATRFGTPEEIEDQVAEWDDLEKLDNKAQQFKPKLDKMQEGIIAQRLSEQEQRKAQQEEASKAYMDSVYNTIVGGSLGNIKLDKKTQEMLYSGLVQPNYPSISGKPTNLLGHLLEKYQFAEPRHDLIAEVLWLLQDPEGYKSKVKEQGGKEVTEKTVRMLKTEEARKNIASSSESEEKERKKPRRTIQRNKGGFFKR